jgi:hypothetical protein
MLFPSAAVKQKAKEGLVGLGGALFYPSVKRSPWAFGFCVRLVCAGCLRGKKSLLFLLDFKRKRFNFFGLGFNSENWSFNDISRS